MRLRTALPIIVVGLLVLLLGIGQRTVWAPAETVRSTISTDVGSAPVTVIGPGIRGDAGGSVDLEITAPGAFTVAVGRSSDVEAWVGDAAHLDVTGVSEETLVSDHVVGEDSVPDPRGSDLWITEEPGEGTLTYRWAPPVEGEWSILLAADGAAPAPTEVTVVRANDRSTPLALPLIIGGSLVLLLGIVGALLAPQRPSGRGGGQSSDSPHHARHEAAPRATGGAAFAARPALVLTGLIGVGSLLGVQAGTAATQPAPTDPSSTTSPSSSADPSMPVATGAPSAGSVASGPPVILESQLGRILTAVADGVAAADAAADGSLLTDRVSGAALDLRSGAYSVPQGDEASAPAPVAAAPVLLDIIPTGPDWPRAVVALTQGDDNPVPQALLLVQESPRENYRLVSAVQMLPGSTFPSPPVPGATGPIAIEESGALLRAPQDAVAGIAALLTDAGSTEARSFEENSFADAITEFQAAVVADPDNESAEISFTHSPVDDRTYALLTGDGGAMVFGYLDHTYTSVPRSEDDSIDLRGTVYQELTGQETGERGLDVTYGEAVMMYVPPAGSDASIRVVGAAQQLLSARLR